MRIRLPVGRTLFFLGAFFLSLIALMPMRMALDWFGLGNRGFAAREVQGSVWYGTFKEAQFATVGLGDLGAGLHAFPLLVGRARFALQRREGAPGDGFTGAANVTRNSFGFDDVTGRLLVTGGAFGRLPLSQVNLSDVTARFENGLCAEATGNVRAAVAGDIAGVTLNGGLTGTARCDAGALLVVMVGQSGMESVELRLFGEGRYTATLLIRSNDTTIRERMGAAGLTLSPLGYEMTVNGTF
jgi:general secretion pathway protein N